MYLRPTCQAKFNLNTSLSFSKNLPSLSSHFTEESYKHFIKMIGKYSLSTHVFVSFHCTGCTYHGERNTRLRHNLASTGVFVVCVFWFGFNSHLSYVLAFRA